MAGASSKRALIRRGFSLVELIVVLSVALLLTGLLLPALGQVRETAFRIVCASNQRQIGLGIFMYASDHDDGLPESSFLGGHGADPQELMVAYRHSMVPTAEGGALVEWDGLGLLFRDGYCSDPGCYYCPSHKGEHTAERYEHMWEVAQPGGRIYTNFHYAGHLDWRTNQRRSLDQGERLVLATDGLRTRQDFNHRVGLNLLAGDGSVTWRDDTIDLYESLPHMALTASAPGGTDDWADLWQRIEDLASRR